MAGRGPNGVRGIADLTPDPRNARRHGPRNVRLIVDALQDVGAARSIVIDEKGTILAGNATCEAAAEAGITRVRVVDADGKTLIAVRRTGLTKAQKARLALYDNRTAELAEGWDPDILRQLSTEMDLSGMFTNEELSALLADPELPGVEEETANRTLAERFGVPPFSVLDARQGYWQERKQAWIALGIRSELGRGEVGGAEA